MFVENNAAVALNVEFKPKENKVEIVKEEIKEIEKEDKKYTYDEVLKASLEYFNGDDLAAEVFVSKYALKDSFNNYYELTPTDMHRRLSREFARIEEKYPNPMTEDEIFDLLDHFKYVVPQGSPMSGIGNQNQLQSLGNCFVLKSPYDSYGGILKTDQELVQLAKRRAGIGIDISNIRPKGMPTKNAAKTTDGIGVFMERFSNSCREVAQGGRRGALLLSISVHHPEIETFINIKRNKNKVTGANVSIRLSDEFMQAVKDDKEYDQRWPTDSNKPTIIKRISARKIWDQIIESAWASAEPGLLFWDNIINNSPADIYASVDQSFKTTSTNPCGELPLGNDSCRLLVVNLLSFVKNPYLKSAKFDYDKYADTVIRAQRLMDDIIDLELECMDKIINKINLDPEPSDIKSIELNMWLSLKKNCENGRRTGLGITALGDALAALNLRYGTDEAIVVTEKIYKQLALNSYKSSCIMAKERGSFPLFEAKLEKGHQFLEKIWEADSEVHNLYKKHGRRNIALNTTAPCGSISILTQTTSGIEPAYLLKYDRFRKVNRDDVNAKVDRVDNLGDTWQKYTVYHHGFKKWMDVTGESDVKKSPYWKATSNDVDWVAGVTLQSKAQFWIDHSISRTANISKDSTKELVSKIYMKAWEEGCKGYTVYRDGCRDGVLVASESDEKTKDGRPEEIQKSLAPKRPTELPCEIHHATAKGQKWTVLIGMLKDKPYEIFAGLSENLSIPSKYSTGKIVKHGKGKYALHVTMDDDELVVKDIVKTFDNQEIAWATRMISLSLRHGIPVEFACDQLSKDGLITDVNRVLSRILKKHIKDPTKKSSCLQCESTDIVYIEGCMQCISCGNSRCS